MNRNLDVLGRLTIPKEMRKQLGIKEGDPVKIELEDNRVIITNPSEVNYKSRCDKAIKHISSLSSKGKGCEIYADVKKDILDILKGE